MRWLTWYEGAAIAAISGLVVAWFRAPGVARRTVGPRWQWVEPAAVELCLIGALYAIWRIARQFPFTQESGAYKRGAWIYHFQNRIHLPSELGLQHFVEAHDWLGPPMSYFYAYVHVPATAAFMFWLFAFHRDRFPHWRNGLVYVTAGCLVIRFVRVAPPRFFPELGFTDLAARYGPSVYGPVTQGVSDQFAAMPSIHVAWAAVVSFGAFAAITSRWRWAALSHVILTMVVVAATGHHWWLDGIVAIGLLWVGLGIDDRWRSSRLAIRDRTGKINRDVAEPSPQQAEPTPASSGKSLVRHC